MRVVYLILVVLLSGCASTSGMDEPAIGESLNYVPLEISDTVSNLTGACFKLEKTSLKGAAPSKSSCGEVFANYYKANTPESAYNSGEKIFSIDIGSAFKPSKSVEMEVGVNNDFYYKYIFEKVVSTDPIDNFTENDELYDFCNNKLDDLNSIYVVDQMYLGCSVKVDFKKAGVNASVGNVIKFFTAQVESKNVKWNGVPDGTTPYELRKKCDELINKSVVAVTFVPVAPLCQKEMKRASRENVSLKAILETTSKDLKKKNLKI
mgnify:CR=1 FL=1